MKKPVLEVRNLSIGFAAEGHHTNAVKEISFAIPAGKITAIVGESGSGKSITSLAIMRLLPKQAVIKGSLVFTPDEQTTHDLLSLSDQQTNKLRGKDISMIFQEPMTSL